MAVDIQLAMQTGAMLHASSPGEVIEVSVIIPVYNECDSLCPLYQMLCDAFATLPRSVEIIFCNDGSSDGSADVLDEIAAVDPRVRVVHLRRNYGQTAAIMAGIQHSIGDIIVPMDADGQNDPSDIAQLIAKLEEGYDVVSGWRKAREDRALSRKLPSIIANRLISWLLGVPLHDYGCTLKAYRREVIEDVRLYGEMHRFIPIYAMWEGARVTELPVHHHARQYGRSKYGLGRIVRVMLDLLMLYFFDRAFDRPIQFFGKIGLMFFGLALLVFGWAIGLKYLADVSLIQTPLPLLATTVALSGILFILLGLMAEVQARIYFESCSKPPYKVKRIAQQSSPALRTVKTGRW